MTTVDDLYARKPSKEDNSTNLNKCVDDNDSCFDSSDSLSLSNYYQINEKDSNKTNEESNTPKSTLNSSQSLFNYGNSEGQNTPFAPKSHPNRKKSQEISPKTVAFPSNNQKDKSSPPPEKTTEDLDYQNSDKFYQDIVPFMYQTDHPNSLPNKAFHSSIENNRKLSQRKNSSASNLFPHFGHGLRRKSIRSSTNSNNSSGGSTNSSPKHNHETGTFQRTQTPDKLPNSNSSSVSNSGSAQKQRKSLFGKILSRKSSSQDSSLFSTSSAGRRGTEIGNSIKKVSTLPYSLLSSAHHTISGITEDSNGRPRMSSLSNFQSSLYRKFSPSHAQVEEYTKDASTQPDGNLSSSIFHLDTDLDNISDIVSPTAQKGSQKNPDFKSSWKAPESWDVSENNIEPEKISDTPSKSESNNVQRIKIFRSDNTFVTISCATSSTTKTILDLIKHKLFSSSANEYRLGFRVFDNTILLNLNEKPFEIRKKFLRKIGYKESDVYIETFASTINNLCRFLMLREAENFNENSVLDLQHLEGYRFISMKGLDMRTIPLYLYKLSSQIRILDFSENYSLRIPLDFIQRCTNVKKIFYANSRLKEIPRNITMAVNLVVLNISGNCITSLDEVNFTGLVKLNEFNLHNNMLRSLPTSISVFTHLKKLNLSQNHFKTFPKEVTTIPFLSCLDISFNDITEIPSYIGDMVSLEKLFISHNNIGQIDPAIKSLKNLKYVDISYNPVKSASILSGILNLSVLYMQHTSVSEFSFSNMKISSLKLDKNPAVTLELTNLNSLRNLSIKYAMLASLSDNIFDSTPNLQSLCLDNNELVTIPSSLSNLKNLSYFSISYNHLQSIPSQIGQLTKLLVFDAHSNNIKDIPEEIWNCSSLSVLNLSSNLVDLFPKCPVEFDNFHLKQKLSYLPLSVKEGQNIPKTKPKLSLANSLKELLLADNRINDESFEGISYLKSLVVLNISFTDIVDIPYGVLGRLSNLKELYINGLNLSSIPAEDIEKITNLEVLFAAGNRLHTLPAELGKNEKLRCLDFGNNTLKYNILNWPYDWNWNFNKGLNYLNLSGNRRLEIKAPHQGALLDEKQSSLAGFNALEHLRLLGLMDVTSTISFVPDESENCRVRTTSCEVERFAYGISDSLGGDTNISLLDTVVFPFRGNDDELIIGIFDGASGTTNGSKVAKYCQDNFANVFSEQLNILNTNETVIDAFRRTFLFLNREIEILCCLPEDSDARERLCNSSRNFSTSKPITKESKSDGATATIFYKNESELYVANIGLGSAILTRTDGTFEVISEKQTAFEPKEYKRLRETSSSIGRNGKLNRVLDASRAFGYFQQASEINCTPHVYRCPLDDTCELLIIANDEFWKFVNYQTAVDIARNVKTPMLASQKLRDFAIAYGAKSKLMVMVIADGGGDSEKSHGESVPTMNGMKLFYGHEEGSPFSFQKRKVKSMLPEDSALARLGVEVDPPVGYLAMVFTDIKNSTLLWETYPIAMRAAIKIHNTVMRRQLRVIGGYEVKTEGDAFMVCFYNVTSAIMWCFSVQSQLLMEDWPSEILTCPEGAEVLNENGNIVYRGLLVRMGIHWGCPVSERDPITRRMDYFGPMVNRAARISAVADGGKIIVSSEVLEEVHKLEDIERKYNAGEISSEVAFENIFVARAVKRDLGILRSVGWSYKSMGRFKLKGLENPEDLYLIYSFNLSYRVTHPTTLADNVLLKANPTILELDLEAMWSLRQIVCRLEYLVERLSESKSERFRADTWKALFSSSISLPTPYLLPIFNNLITRLENCITSLTVYYGLECFDENIIPIEEFVNLMRKIVIQKR